MTLHGEDADRVAAVFGVDRQQVARDHLISVLLSFLSNSFADRLTFFGGTALGRTHLVHGRLSEDLDLIARGDRGRLAVALNAAIPGASRREVGVLEWDPPLDQTSDSTAGVIRVTGGPSVHLQLLRSVGYPPWPTERRVLHERYRGIAPATLSVPTPSAFAAWKTSAWHDRRAPRDLWDLSALADIGAIDATATQLYIRHGPTGRPPSRVLFQSAPSVRDWRSQLGGQTRLTIGPEEALHRVLLAWGAAVRAAGSTWEDM